MGLQEMSPNVIDVLTPLQVGMIYERLQFSGTRTGFRFVSLL